MLLKFTRENGKKVAFHCSFINTADEHKFHDGSVGTEISGNHKSVFIKETLDEVIATVNAAEVPK